jgi:pimeloyl-ACP methyl ester carboxylesterase
VNNDYDLYERDLNIPRGANCDDNVINGFRDLEDFARLWISGLPALPSSQGYSVSLSWRNATGNPSIKLYRAYEADGGTAYLQDTNVALQQVLYSAWPGVGGYGGSIGAVSLPGPFGAGPFTFPSNYFAVQGTNMHFLFEGAGIGKGELVLTISQGTNVLAETSAWFDLRDIKDMYEQVDIRDVSDATPNTLTSTYHETKTLSDDASEDKSVIVFVHGWRMGQFDYYSFSESMFKRLYWQGFKGRFAALRWQTLSKDDFNSLVDVLNDFQSLFTYNKSEFRAFQSGRGVSDYFTHLRERFPDRTIGVCAHSMGGIVTMQALRLQLAAGQTNIDNLVIMQAAVPAHCYDASLANYAPFLAAETNILSMRTPDTYRSYPGAINSAVRNQIVNFFNTNDFALATGTVQGFGSVSWEGNEISYKPDQGFGYSSDGTNAYKSFVLLSDARQIMSFVARPRSKAVGALPGVNGVIHGGQVDLKGNFGFDTDKSEHSAQFNWNIHRLNGFYSQLLTDLLQ